MNFPWLKKYLSQSDLKEIEEAVKRAEKTTSGEIVPMIVKSSSTVGHVPLLVFTILLLSFYLLGIYDFTHEHYEKPWFLTFCWSIASLVLSVWLSRKPLVQRFFINSRDRESQTITRAMNEFYHAKMDETKESTGILLFMSLDDHKAVVLADKKISDVLGKDTWTDLVSILVQGAKKKKIKQGFIEAIDLCGSILKPHFPIKEGDKNELSNHLVIKE